MTKVLFVEDEPWGVDSYFSRLERYDFQCELAKSLNEAIEKLQHEKFDMLSLDIMFSRGKSVEEKIEHRSAGLRLLQLIRTGKIGNCDPNLKVIVLTALASSQIEQQVRQLGVFAYLTKPIAFNKVIGIFKRSRQQMKIDQKINPR
ncbi:MAG: response regulator [bacterium]